MSKNRAFFNQIRQDAKKALKGHWSRPVFSGFLLIAAAFSALFLPVSCKELWTSLGLPFMPWGEVAVAVLLCSFVLFPCAIYSGSADVFFDALANGQSQPDAREKAKSDRFAAGSIKIGNWVILLLGYGAFAVIFLAVAGMLKARLSDFVFLRHALLTILAIFGLWLTGYFVERISCLRWLATVLLAEGYAKDKKQALAFSKGVLRPNRKLLMAYVGFSLPRLLLCLLVIPMLVILPEYRTGRAILCRYCLMKEQRKRLQELTEKEYSEKSDKEVLNEAEKAK